MSLKEARLTEIALEIQRLGQQKEQQQVQLRTVEQQATEMKRQIAESSFYEAAARGLTEENVKNAMRGK